MPTVGSCAHRYGPTLSGAKRCLTEEKTDHGVAGSCTLLSANREYVDRIMNGVWMAWLVGCGRKNFVV